MNPPASVAPPAASTQRLSAIVPLLMLVVAFGHFNRVGISVAGAERLIPELHISETHVGYIYSAFLYCYTLAMLPGGWLIDRFGPRRALMAFTFGSALFAALTGWVGWQFRDAWSVWLGLMIVRSLMGLINAPLHPSAARLVHDTVLPERRARANGFATCAACLGVSVTYFGLGTLIDIPALDWPGAFLVSAVLTFIVGLVWTFATRSIGPAPADGALVNRQPTLPSAHSIVGMLQHRGVVCISIAYGALGYFQYLFFYWIQHYFKTVGESDASVARWYTTYVTLAMGAGMVLGGFTTDLLPARWPRYWRRALVPIVGMLASGAVFEVGVWSSNPQLSLAAFMFSAALIGACEGSFWTTVVELGGRLGGTAGALMNTGGNLGGALSPSLTPLLGTWFGAQWGETMGWRISLSIAGVIVMLGAALWWGVRPESPFVTADETS